MRLTLVIDEGEIQIGLYGNHRTVAIWRIQRKFKMAVTVPICISYVNGKAK